MKKFQKATMENVGVLTVLKKEMEQKSRKKKKIDQVIMFSNKKIKH